MSKEASAKTDCRLVAEYVDEMDVPAPGGCGVGEVIRPQLVAEYLDATIGAVREFTVLLRNGGCVTVRGHALKQWPARGGESESYGVVIRAQQEEVLIALYRSVELIGIFDGELRLDRGAEVAESIIDLDKHHGRWSRAGGRYHLCHRRLCIHL